MKHITKFNSIADALACQGLLTPQVCLIGDQMIQASKTKYGNEIIIKQEGGKLVPETSGPLTLYIADSTPGETPGSIQYEDGMTWEAWVNSKYNIYKIKARFSKVTDDGAVHMLINADTYDTIDKYSLIDSTINYKWEYYD